MKLKFILGILKLIPNNLIVTIIDLAIGTLTKKLPEQKRKKYRKAAVNILKAIIKEAGEAKLNVKPDEVTVEYGTRF